MSSSPIEVLRKRYHDHLASEPSLTPAARQGAGNEGRREGRIAGRETRKGMRQAAQWHHLTESSWSELESVFLSNPHDLMVWSDLHLDHANIIRYAQRPFGGSFHMNSQLLYNAREKVREDQWLLFVGDLAMWRDRERIQQWMKQCPGRKALVIGNHDVRGKQCPKRLEDWQDLGFEAVSDVAWLPAAHGLPQVWITHYPLPMSKFDDPAVNLHGHTHTKVLGSPWVNVCVEQIQYQPHPVLDLLSPALI